MGETKCKADSQNHKAELEKYKKQEFNANLPSNLFVGKFYVFGLQQWKSTVYNVIKDSTLGLYYSF